MIVVVSDTSPVRALGHLGCLDVLRDLFGRVLVPPAVEQELRHPPLRMAGVDVRRLPFIEVRPPQDQNQVNRFHESLDRGESEALALALEVQASAILIDERAGRGAAARLGFPVIGTLGTLLRSRERGLIPAVRPLIDRLESELGFFISRALREEILHRAGE